MELTKNQIKEIDQILKQKGIRYWDARLEMIDHIVTDVEKKLDAGEEYKKALKEAIELLGWNKNLHALNNKLCRTVNKKYRSLYFREFVLFFKSIKNIILLFVFFGVEYNLFNSVELETFTDINYQLFLLPIVIIVGYGFINLKHKLGKSIHHIYGFFYTILSFLVLNMFMLFFVSRNVLSFEDPMKMIVTTVIISLHLIFSYSGILVYRKALSNVLEMKKIIKG